MSRPKKDITNLDELRAELARAEAEEIENKRAELLIQQKRDYADKKTVHDLDTLNYKRSYLSIGSWVDWYRTRFQRSKTIICNFELCNGLHTTAICVIQDGAVWFRGKPYIVDDTLKYYHLGLKSYVLDFHESYSISIKRKIPLEDVSQTMRELNLGNVAYATNPSALKTFQVNEVIKAAIQSASITDFFKSIRLMAFIGAAASVLVLLLVAHGQGLFSGLGIGG